MFILFLLIWLKSAKTSSFILKLVSEYKCVLFLLTQLWERNVHPKSTLFFLYGACIMPQNVTLMQCNKFEMWNVTLTQDVTTFDAKGNNIFNSKCKKQNVKAFDISVVYKI